MINLDHIQLRRGPRSLLDDASARIHPGQKIALIGSNGAGKSSVFKLLLGELSVDAGHLQLPDQWRIAHMAQETEATGRAAIEFVIDGDAVLRQTEQAIEQAQQQDNHEALAQLYGSYEEQGGYNARLRAEMLLHGLGFSGDEILQPVSTFSGGWRIRLNLAQALMTPSDLLLLDEPTNHLDLDASLWLEDWLSQYSGTLLLISHDRDFIDKVCDQIIQIEHQKLWTYRGNYSAYERQRAERLARDQASYEKQQRRKAEIEQFVRRFKAKASKAKQAQSRVKELERMEELAPAHIDSPFDFAFPEPERFSDPLLNLTDARLGYNVQAPVLTAVNLSIHPGSRIGLLGANGAGKSTLIKSLVEELPLLSGQRTRGEHLALGYFSQHQVDSLDMSASPLLLIQRLSPQATEQEIRNFLGSFDFLGDRVKEEIKRFSGGEKARLALAAIVWQKPNLLLLDEPTNHLDLEMCHALTVALQSFQGAVVLVSHDRHLIKNCVDQLMLVADGRASPFDGDLDDYSRWLLSRLKEDRTGAGQTDSVISGEMTRQDKKKQRQEAADLRRQLAPLKKQVSRLENDIGELESRLAKLEEELADTALYDSENKAELQQLLKLQGSLNSEKDDKEAQWCELLEELEQKEAEINQ